MNYIRKASERGGANFGWLDSKHSFSFGHYYDPKHMGVSALRVINDDKVAPSQGFDTHGHQNMEIISYVTKGALKHKDSEGNEFVVPAGDIQIMSAGSGIQHSEYNASDSEDVEFLQIWIKPNVMNQKPSYGQRAIEQQGKLTPLVTPDGLNGTLAIKQDARVSRVVLKKGESLELNAQNSAYLHIVKGSVSVKEQTFTAGDAFATEQQTLTLTVETDLEALWFELP